MDAGLQATYSDIIDPIRQHIQPTLRHRGKAHRGDEFKA
jgi:hypothetical protein